MQKNYENHLSMIVCTSTIDIKQLRYKVTYLSISLLIHFNMLSVKQNRWWEIKFIDFSGFEYKRVLHHINV